MILTQQKEAEVYIVGEDSENNTSIKMSLDTDSQQMLMQLLSKNLYSDEIGSPIRELASNALDSHRRAGRDKEPIIVSFKTNNEGNYEYSVEDFGVGLDDIDVRDIISKYGKSLAREEVNALGLMGLGFKSPLAYTPAFYFIARKNGMERNYTMYEGEDGGHIDLLYESKTELRDGVKVIMPVKYSDKYNFVNKIKEQLAYFENVYFDVPNTSSINGVNNNFTIFREEDFQYSEIVTDRSLHICLDNVYYPIDWQKLGISRIDNVGIGLRFNLTDGIYPVPSRESIRYTPEAKEIIINKIKKVAEYFVSQYNKEINDIDNIDRVFEHYSTSERYVKIEGKSINISPLLHFTDIVLSEPKIEGVELLDLNLLTKKREYLVGEYKVIHVCRYNKFKEIDNKYLSAGEIDNEHYYIFSERFVGNKREYLKSLFSDYYSTYYFVKKSYSYRLGFPIRGFIDQNSYFSILQLKNYSRDKWRQVIKEFQYVQSLYISRFKNVDEIEIPKTWLDKRKQDRKSLSNGGTRRVKLQGEVIGRLARDLERRVGLKNCKFDSQIFKLADIHCLPYLIIYTNHDNSELLDNIYHIHGKHLNFITFSDRDMKIIEKSKIHNLISYTEFMEGNNKPFKRLITAYLIKNLEDTYTNVFRKYKQLDSISLSLTEEIQSLIKYRMDNYQHASEDVYLSMLEVAKVHDLFDMEIYSTYLKIKELLEKLTFLDQIMSYMNSYKSKDEEDENLKSILVDLFKYYKQRIDYTNYNITINDTTWMDEVLEDEVAKEAVVEVDEEEILVEEIEEEL